MKYLLTAVVMRYSVAASHPQEPIFGGVLTYLLIAIVFGNIYLLIARHLPEAFLENGELLKPTYTNMRYFSFTALTTCGFGDIVPTMPFIRILTGLEASIGVLYVGIFIGKLISITRRK